MEFHRFCPAEMTYYHIFPQRIQQSYQQAVENTGGKPNKRAYNSYNKLHGLAIMQAVLFYAKKSLFRE